MRKIAVFNQKGGVGKTTTALNIAAGLSRNGKSVIVIDLDPQASVHAWHDIECKKNLTHVLTENAPLEKAITKLGKNLDLMFCDEGLADAEESLFTKQNVQTILDSKFTPGLDYDYVILDCPPSLRPLNKAALSYAREVVIPASTDPLGHEALKKTMQSVQEINKTLNKRLMVSSIIPTLHDKRSKMCKLILSKMREEFTPLLVADPIHQCSKVREAPHSHKSVFSHAKSSQGAKDYWNLVKLLLENEYMYDSRIKLDLREKALKEYFVEGKKRQLVMMGNKVTFSFTYLAQMQQNMKGHLHNDAEKKPTGETA